MKPCLTLFSLLTCVWLTSFSSWASIDAYPFSDELKEAQFKELINELRCPKCQNQTISDSDAPLAKDLKDKTYAMVQEGASKEAVINYMVDRYGNFVHYQPPLQSSTWVLWFGPFIFLLLAGVGIVIMVRRRANKVAKPVALNAEEKARLAALINNNETKS